MAIKKKNKIIEVKNLVKRYKKAKENAVDSVSFYVEKGAFFSLLGPNGAGKTTIVSILNTTLSKTSGQVTVNGHEVEKNPARVRRQIGVIFQTPSLDLNLTAEENIRFHVNLYGLFPYRPSYLFMAEEYKKRVGELSRILGIEKDIHKPVKTFSGGMKRKLEIVKSLMHRPRILFLDEPTTGLDPLSRLNLWEYLQKVRAEEKTTIFLTTHYLEEAEGADYLGIINQGKLAARGTPAEIKEKLIEKYLLVDALARDKLRKELKINKLSFSGAGPYKISLNGQSAQTVIKKIKTPLSVLKIHTPTLEQAYIKIINQDSKK